jgi:hypothetical protein
VPRAGNSCGCGMVMHLHTRTMQLTETKAESSRACGIHAASDEPDER